MMTMDGISNILEPMDGPVRLLIYGEFLLFATIIASRRPAIAGSLPLLALILTTGSYLFLSGPWAPLEGMPRLVLIGLTSLTPFVLWAVALQFFDDGFRLPVWPWPTAALIGTGAAGLEFTGEWEGTLRNVFRIASLIALAHAIWVMLTGWRDDLVETRRRARAVLVGLIVLQAGISLIVELVYSNAADRAPLEPLAAIGILVLTTALAAMLLRPVASTTERSAPSAKVSEPIPDAAAPSDGLIERLQSLIEEGGLFAPGLTIASLAEHLGVPEYRLRRTINQGLGYRNFSSFLNRHRVAEAQRRLHDPANARLSVLTIAMDLGYGSLGPFNRAFREITGQTPSEFRQHGEKTSPIPGKPD